MTTWLRKISNRIFNSFKRTFETVHGDWELPESDDLKEGYKDGRKKLKSADEGGIDNKLEEFEIISPKVEEDDLDTDHSLTQLTIDEKEENLHEENAADQSEEKELTLNEIQIKSIPRKKTCHFMIVFPKIPARDSENLNMDQDSCGKEEKQDILQNPQPPNESFNIPKELPRNTTEFHKMGQHHQHQQVDELLPNDSALIEEENGKTKKTKDLNVPYLGNSPPWMNWRYSCSLKAEPRYLKDTLQDGKTLDNQSIGSPTEILDHDANCMFMENLKCDSMEFSLQEEESLELEKTKPLSNNLGTVNKKYPSYFFKNMQKITPPIDGTLDEGESVDQKCISLTSFQTLDYPSKEMKFFNPESCRIESYPNSAQPTSCGRRNQFDWCLPLQCNESISSTLPTFIGSSGCLRNGIISDETSLSGNNDAWSCKEESHSLKNQLSQMQVKPKPMIFIKNEAPVENTALYLRKMKEKMEDMKPKQSSSDLTDILTDNQIDILSEISSFIGSNEWDKTVKNGTNFSNMLYKRKRESQINNDQNNTENDIIGKDNRLLFRKKQKIIS